MTAELLLLGQGSLDSTLTIAVAWLAHAIAGIVCAVAFGIGAWLRSSSRPRFLGYQERYLVGIGLGIVTSLAISITYASLDAESFPNAVESAGTFMVFSLLSMELPVACIVGGLAWHLLSKARGDVARPRRAIEDAE
jgi:hypothetical protein